MHLGDVAIELYLQPDCVAIEYAHGFVAGW